MYLLLGCTLFIILVVAILVLACGMLDLAEALTCGGFDWDDDDD